MAGVVLRHGFIRGGVRHAHGPTSQVSPGRRCVAAAIHAGQGHARSRIGAGGRLRDARVVFCLLYTSNRRISYKREQIPAAFFLDGIAADPPAVKRIEMQMCIRDSHEAC